ncbi:MAG: FkbM family methyltransferase [Alphaproteobacteria bacterium]|nr:FkbM family methyltransferase [Alphaproteobacteria bacterium]
MVVLQNWSARFDWLAHLGKAMFQNHHQELIPKLRPHIPQDAVILDKGAHAGQMAKLFARLAPRGHVYAFEPGSYALSILKPAVYASGLSNIEIVPVGLSDSPGISTLQMPIKRHGGYGFGLAHLGEASDGRPGVEDEIALTTIDQFMDDRRLQRVDFVKIDIEGWEVPCVRGGWKTVERFRPTLMLEIVDKFLARAGTGPTDLFEPLLSLGYTARRMNLDVAVERYTGPGDYLFAT